MKSKIVKVSILVTITLGMAISCEDTDPRCEEWERLELVCGPTEAFPGGEHCWYECKEIEK